MFEEPQETDSLLLPGQSLHEQHQRSRRHSERAEELWSTKEQQSCGQQFQQSRGCCYCFATEELWSTKEQWSHGCCCRAANLSFGKVESLANPWKFKQRQIG